MDPTAAAVYVLLGLVALRVIIVGIGAALLLRPVRDCPACFADATFRAHHRWLRLLAPWLEWRFCPRCGWHGPSRRLARGQPGPPGSAMTGVTRNTPGREAR